MIAGSESKIASADQPPIGLTIGFSLPALAQLLTVYSFFPVFSTRHEEARQPPQSRILTSSVERPPVEEGGVSVCVSQPLSSFLADKLVLREVYVERDPRPAGKSFDVPSPGCLQFYSLLRPPFSEGRPVSGDVFCRHGVP